MFDRHLPLGYHPERPERLVAARAGLARAEVATVSVEAREASDDQLAAVHEPAYLERLARLAGERAFLDPDTFVGPDSVAAARRAAGGACALVDGILAGEIDRGFALVRPPGHHARPGAAMGFCLLNNVAVAAAHARARGVRRVAIVDWDVHHGNGTEEMFASDPSVLYASLHQWPFYPGTGAASEIGRGEGRGYTVNVPLTSGAGPGDYGAAFDRIVLPVLEAFAPDLLLVSAGFDAHSDDPLATMCLTADAYGGFTRALTSVCSRTVVVLEGGYDLRAIEASVEVVARALSGAPGEGVVAAPARGHEAEIERARRHAGATWRV